MHKLQPVNQSSSSSRWGMLQRTTAKGVVLKAKWLGHGLMTPSTQISQTNRCYILFYFCTFLWARNSSPEFPDWHSQLPSFFPINIAFLQIHFWCLDSSEKTFAPRILCFHWQSILGFPSRFLGLLVFICVRLFFSYIFCFVMSRFHIFYLLGVGLSTPVVLYTRWLPFCPSSISNVFCDILILSRCGITFVYPFFTKWYLFFETILFSSHFI